jgi:CHAT domain-containing protein
MPSRSSLITLAFCLCYATTFTQAVTRQDPIRQLYNAFNDAETEGREDKLKDIQKQALSFLANSKQLSQKQLGLLYTIAGQVAQEANGDVDNAVIYLEKAYKLCSTEYGSTSEEALAAKKCLSWAYSYTGHPELERQLSMEMLDYYLKDKKKNIVEITDLYHTNGMDYGLEGNRQDEQRFYLTGIESMEHFQAETPAMIQAKQYYLGLLYNSISLSYYADNNYEAALIAARKSLYYRNLIMPRSQQLAANWMIIGRSLYQTEGNADTALYYLDKAIGILEKKADNNTSMIGSSPWVTYKGYKAEILMKANRTPEAILITKATINQIEKNKSSNPQSAVSLIYNYCSLSSSCIAMNNAAEALQVMEKIKEELSNNNTVTKLAAIKLNTQYAVALSANKLWSQAAEAFSTVVQATGVPMNKLQQSSYSIPVTVPFEFLYVYVKAADNLVESGLATHHSPTLLAGINMLRKVATSLEQRKTLYFAAGIDEGIGAQDFGVYDDLLNALYCAKDLMSEADRLRLAFEAIESSKANLLKYGLLEENHLSAFLPGAENNRRVDLKTKVYEAIKNVQENGDLSLQDTLLKAKERYLQYLQAVRKKYAVSYSKQQQVIAVSDPMLNQHEETVINYFLGQNFLYAFIHQHGSQQFIRKEIIPQFYNYLTYITQRHISKTDLTAAPPDSFAIINHQLYNWLLSGIALQGELVIIPHKQLSLISFEMLNTGNNKIPAYVIEKCAVRYALSASLMQPTAKDNKAANTDFFGGFASSNFDISKANNTLLRNGLDTLSRGSTTTLDGTSREVQNIAVEMKGNAYIHSTPSDFLQHATQYQILHIATHAIANQGINHQCNFLFESDSTGNNIVSDAEIAALSLHADMAVLSACNTGLGKMNSGEGMTSLGRSFFVAGCPSVVMSLWMVNDESTASIMTAFYRHLQQGETKSQALRNAKLEYIKSQTNPLKKDPYYWAGFIVTGDNTPLQRSNHIILWSIIALISILLIGGIYIYWRNRSSRSFT